VGGSCNNGDDQVVGLLNNVCINNACGALLVSKLGGGRISVLGWSTDGDWRRGGQFFFRVSRLPVVWVLSLVGGTTNFALGGAEISAWVQNLLLQPRCCCTSQLLHSLSVMSVQFEDMLHLLSAVPTEVPKSGG